MNDTAIYTEGQYLDGTGLDIKAKCTCSALSIGVSSEAGVVSTNSRNEGVGLIETYGFGQVAAYMQTPTIIAGAGRAIEPTEVEGASLSLSFHPASI